MFQNPAVVGSRVFVGSCAGTFYGLESRSGEVLWRYDTASEGTPSTFHADPVVVGDVVIAAADGSEGARIQAFELATGHVRWFRVVPPRGVSTGLVANADTVFALTNGGDLLALAVADGALRWSARMPAGDQDRRGRLALDGGQLVAVEADGAVLAFDAGSGRPSWRQDLGEPLDPEPRLDGDHLGLVTRDGAALRLARTTGSVEARTELAAGTAFGGLVAAGPCLVIQLAPRTVVCSDPATGAVRWKTQLEADLTTFVPAAGAGVVWVGDESGRLSALATADGQITRVLFAPGIPRGLALAGDALVVGTLNGAIVGFSRVSAPPAR